MGRRTLIRAPRRWSLALAAFVACLGAASAASATPAARLVYLRGKGTETCPDETDVRQAVVRRLGYDPFSSYAPSTMFTEVSSDGTSFSANLKLVDGDNAVRGDRVLKTRGGCAELMEAMALTISIAIDPESPTRQGPPPDAPPFERPVTRLPSLSTDEPESAPAEAIVGPDVVREPHPATPLVISASLGPLMSVGTAPSVAVGGVLAMDGQYGPLFAGIEGRADAPASGSAVPSGRVSSSLLLASLFVGLRRGVVFASAVGGVGSVHATSRDVAEQREADALTANAGVRVGVGLPLTDWLELRARLEGLVNLTRHRLDLDGREAYRFPVVSANASVAAAVRFW